MLLLGRPIFIPLLPFLTLSYKSQLTVPLDSAKPSVNVYELPPPPAAHSTPVSPELTVNTLPASPEEIDGNSVASFAHSTAVAPELTFNILLAFPVIVGNSVDSEPHSTPS